MKTTKSSFTYKLEYPLKHEGHELKEIVIHRRPTVADQIEVAEKTSGMPTEVQTLHLYSRITGLSVEELGRVDYYTDWANFLEKSALFFGLKIFERRT